MVEHTAAGIGPWWWVRWRSAVLDASLASASAVECAVEGIPFARDAGLPVPVGVGFGLVAGSCAAVARRWPIAVVLVSIAITPAQMGFLMDSSGCTRWPRPSCRAGSSGRSRGCPSRGC